MKRKLIDFDVFRKITNESLSASESELTLAEDVLARALGVDALKLHCFSEANVTFETPDKSYIHATYQLKDKTLTFENIEELVIDETTERKEAKTILTDMIDDLLQSNEQKAHQAFEHYMKLPVTRRSLMEGNKNVNEGFPFKKGKKKGCEEKMDRKSAFKKSFGSKGKASKFKKAPPFKKLDEWHTITENVIGYIDYQEHGPTMRESVPQHDDKGNLTGIRLPTAHIRNENKLLTFNWKMLNTQYTIMRSKMKKISEDDNFCRAMADLRKCNAMSDAEQLDNVLEAVVGRWPDLIYLSQIELAKEIASALESMGEQNYDDRMCDFMAEGILRIATEAYTDRVRRIMQVGGIEAQPNQPDLYEQFQAVANEFYPALDESAILEMQVFADLYNALVEVHKVASYEGNEMVRTDAHRFLGQLASVLNQESEPTLELAGEVASWLDDITEANVEGASEKWDVSGNSYMTHHGEHPKMAQLAKVPAVPGRYEGDWPDIAPVSDGKKYTKAAAEEMRNRSWGNYSDDETWPSLQNPYVPKPFGEYKMKEKSAIDDGQSDWSRWQSKDTWPALQNPYVPERVLGRKAMTPQNYKMKEKDLVVDLPDKVSGGQGTLSTSSADQLKLRTKSKGGR
jgi:hypothetical protein